MARQQIYNFKPAVHGDTWDGAIITLEVNDAPKDLTGASVKMWLIKSQDADPVKEFSTTGGEIVISDAAGGEITFVPWNIVDIPAGNYHYDLEYTFQDGKVKTYARGVFAVINDLSK